MEKYINIIGVSIIVMTIVAITWLIKELFIIKAKRIKHKDWTECSNCGGSIGESGMYCKNCGAKLVEAQNAK